MAVFYAATSLAGAFSGLLAYAIQQMDGVAGMSGWKVRTKSSLSSPLLIH